MWITFLFSHAHHATKKIATKNRHHLQCINAQRAEDGGGGDLLLFLLSECSSATTTILTYRHLNAN